MAVFTGLPLVFSAEGQAAFWGDPVLGLGSAVGHESQPDLHKPALKPTGSGVLATHGALLSQAELSPSTQALPVTVVLQNTDQGLELVLTSMDGNAESVPLSAQAEVEGNRQRYVLNSVRLVQEERWVDPVEGIAAIAATNQPGDRLLIEITGSQAAAPEIKVVTTETGITFRFVAPAVPATGTNPATEASPATETQPSTEGISLVVTAQKREEEAQTVPIALTVFDEEAITDQQISSFSDLTARTPNFNFPQNVSGRIFGFYSLRGLNNGNFLNRRDVLGVYVDDVPLEYGAFLTGDFFDIERIEFLRGPQSTLYGRNSQAGAINIISRPPSNEPEARINSSYGNFDSKSFGLSFSDALIPDQLKFRLAANYRGTDGFTRNRFLDTNAGEQQDVQVRGELLWTPSNRWELSARAGGSWLNDGDSVYAAIDADDPYEVEYNRDGKLENQSTTQALKIVHRADTFEATSISTHRFSEQNGRETEGDYSPLDLFVADYSFGAEVWSQEIRFQSPDSADRLRWLLGGYFEANQSTVDGEGFTIVGQGVDEIFSETQQRTWAGFGQVDFKPVEPLTLSAGLRYEYNSGRFDRDRFFTPEGSGDRFPGGISFRDETTSDTVLLPKFSLSYAFSPQLSAYGSIGRGYKAGGFNYRADDASVLVFEPEKSWSYEVGLKSNWLDDRLQANLALFITDLQDYQVALPGPDGFFRNITNAEVGIRGLELELLAEPVDGLSLNASLGLLSGEFKRYKNPFSGEDFSGNRLNYTPNLTYNLGAQYRSASGLFGRVELQGLGTTYFDDGNQLKQDPYVIANARIGYEAQDYSIYFFANNLFNQEYLNNAFIFPPPTVIGSFGERTNYGIQTQFRF